MLTTSSDCFGHICTTCDNGYIPPKRTSINIAVSMPHELESIIILVD